MKLLSTSLELLSTSLKLLSTSPIPTNPGELQAILDMVGSEIMVRIQNLLDQGLTVTQVLVTSIGDTQVGRRGLRRLAAVSTKYNAFITGNNVKDDLDTNQVTTSASSTALVISVPSMSPTPKPTNNPSPSPIKAPSTTPTVTVSYNILQDSREILGLSIYVRYKFQ